MGSRNLPSIFGGFFPVEYRGRLIGFDSLFEQLDRASNEMGWGNEKFPPYNLERITKESGPEKFRLTLAVAGYRPEQISLDQTKDVLTVTGEADKSDQDGPQMLHVGIAKRSFTQRFQLAEHTRVVDAMLQDGILTIELVREIPEESRPRMISIRTTNLIDSK